MKKMKARVKHVEDQDALNQDAMWSERAAFAAACEANKFQTLAQEQAVISLQVKIAYCCRVCGVHNFAGVVSCTLFAQKYGELASVLFALTCGRILAGFMRVVLAVLRAV